MDDLRPLRGCIHPPIQRGHTFDIDCTKGYYSVTFACVMLGTKSICSSKLVFTSSVFNRIHSGNSKSNKTVRGIFSVLAKVKTVLRVGFILAVSILAIWLNDSPDSKAS